MVPHLPDWQLELSQDVLPNVQPGEIRVVTLTVTPPADLPPEGQPIVDVEGYVGGNLIGGFRKLFFPPTPVHRPEDPPYAEREIAVFPYPPRAGEPTRIEFEARNPTGNAQQMTVIFEVGWFGIGLPFTPIDSQVIVLPPHGSSIVGTNWVPPIAGDFCVRVRVEAPFFQEPFVSAHNVSAVRLPPPYGTPEVFPFVVGDNGIVTRPLTVTLGLREYLPDWSVDLSPREIVFAAGQAIATAVLTITPPPDPAALPRDGGPIADVSGYVNGELIGGIRKVWRPPVPLGQLGEPGYAESEITITPDPPVAGHPVTFTAELRNNTAHPYTVTAEFGWAGFGIGIPFSNTNVVPPMATVMLGPYVTQTISAVWTPQRTGYYCVQVILTDDETHVPQRSQRNVDVERRNYVPCAPFSKEFWLQNSTPLTVTVTIGASAINLPQGWTYSTSVTETVLLPFRGVTVTVTITPPCGLMAQGVAPLLDTGGASGPPTLDIEGFDQDGQLLGGVEFQLEGAVLDHQIFLPLVLRNY